MATNVIKKKDGESTNSSTSGYLKMPNGVLIQWGKQNVTTNASDGATRKYRGTTNGTVYYPIPFVGNAPAIITNLRDNAAYWGSSASTTTNLDRCTLNIAGNASGTRTVDWLAIGMWR